RRPVVAGRAGAGAGGRRRPGGRAAPGRRRDDRLLRGGRGPDQHRPPFRCQPGGGDRGPPERAPQGGGDRRRHRRRRHQPGHRAGRPPRPRPGRRRDAAHPQPGRRADHPDRGAAVRIVIAEDAVLLRAGLTRLLADAGHDVVAAVGDAEALMGAVEAQKPDIVVTDVRMPPHHQDEGLKAAVELRARYPQLAILVLSQYVEERYATELLAGDSRGLGYLLKDRVAEVGEFVGAVERVAGGGTALDPDVVTQLLARTRRADPLAALTPRERAGLQLMAEGRSNTAIAATL